MTPQEALAQAVKSLSSGDGDRWYYHGGHSGPHSNEEFAADLIAALPEGWFLLSRDDAKGIGASGYKDGLREMADAAYTFAVAYHVNTDEPYHEGPFMSCRQDYCGDAHEVLGGYLDRRVQGGE